MHKDCCISFGFDIVFLCSKELRYSCIDCRICSSRWWNISWCYSDCDMCYRLHRHRHVDYMPKLGILDHFVGMYYCDLPSLSHPNWLLNCFRCLHVQLHAHRDMRHRLYRHRHVDYMPKLGDLDDFVGLYRFVFYLQLIHIGPTFYVSSFRQ